MQNVVHEIFYCNISKEIFVLLQFWQKYQALNIKLNLLFIKKLAYSNIPLYITLNKLD